MKSRLPWLYVNLLTAFMAAAVVAIFLLFPRQLLSIYVNAGPGVDAAGVDVVPDEPHPVDRRATASPASARPISPRTGRS